MSQLQTLLKELEFYIPQHQLSSQSVSSSTIGWQLEHSLLTINAIIQKVATSNPSDYKWSFKMPRLIVFTIGKIPRGRAKSPKNVQPGNMIDEQSLINHLHQTLAQLEQLEGLGQDQFFEHPIFGHLKKAQAIRFLEIHTKHHLDIIKDISLKANK